MSVRSLPDVRFSFIFFSFSKLLSGSDARKLAKFIHSHAYLVLRLFVSLNKVAHLLTSLPSFLLCDAPLPPLVLSYGTEEVVYSEVYI